MENAGMNKSGAGRTRGSLARTLSWAAVLWIASGLATPATARAASNQAEDPEVAPALVTVPVVFDGETLIRLRGTSAIPAAKRAQLVEDRIGAIAADMSIPVNEMRLEETAETTRIMARDRLAMVVGDADAAVEGVPRRTLSEIYLDRIKSAVERYRHERSPRVLLKSTLYALGASLALALILFVIVRMHRRFESAIERRYKSKVQGLHIQSFQVVAAEKLWFAVHRALHIVRVLASLIACLGYANFVLGCFPWTRPLAARGVALLLDPMRTMGSALLASVPNLVFIAVLIVIVRYFLKLALLFFEGIQYGTVTVSGFDRDWALPTYKILRLLIIALAAVVAYPYIPGSQSEAFKGVSIFVGIMFSLGSTSAVANIIAGYMLTYRRAFKVGDRIQVMDLVGDVVETRLQVTHLRSVKNEEMIVPNSQILNSHVVNYSRLAKDSGLILHTTVGIGYETPWRQVESMLLIAAERTSGLLREPPPFVLQKELGDFCVTYEINVYCDCPQESPKLYSLLHRNILDVFNEYGVQIMTPAYEGDPAEAKVVPKDKWFEAPAKHERASGGA
jgi:small-conductance mechanosensitive channel